MQSSGAEAFHPTGGPLQVNPSRRDKFSFTVLEMVGWLFLHHYRIKLLIVLKNNFFVQVLGVGKIGPEDVRRDQKVDGGFPGANLRPHRRGGVSNGGEEERHVGVRTQRCHPSGKFGS